MNLEKMFEMQAELDNRIIKEKGLEGQDLLPNTYVALITELGEFANEGRWFKHWSDDQRARNQDRYLEYRTEALGGNQWVEKNPLLEEYVDCIHFFLSIAIIKGWKEELSVSEAAIEEFKEEGFEGGLSGLYLEMQWSLLNSRMFKDEEKKKEHFRVAWGLFLAIGIVGFGFTPDQIAAYMDKNEVNHKRQQEGY
ncbi:dUTP diphosphatase [Bacillus pumilus]|uniref:dUTP diphosphatase n=1 Tax=Bacillus pumilus TaxID=1408 RepID=UPI0007176346|nr:dUTP diphosphatase [Bacillus pumilus]KRU14792.1 dUTPase [Bacillus pumilus]